MKHKETPKRISIQDKSTPTSSKSSLLEYCIKCEARFSSKDRGKHTERFCQILSKDWRLPLPDVGDSLEDGSSTPSLRPAQPLHGYFKEGQLFARLVDTDLKEKELEAIPDNYHDCLLLMHWEAIKYLELKVGDSVAFNPYGCLDGLRDEVICCILWPHESIRNPCSVSFFGRPLNEDCIGLVCATKIINPIQPKCVLLKALNPLPRSVDLVDLTCYLKKQLDKRCIYSKMVLSVDYKSIRLAFECTASRGEDGMVSCIKSLECLSVEDKRKAEPTFYCISNITRVIIPSENRVCLKDVGGLKTQLEALRDLIELPLQLKQQIERIGLSPPKGALLYGVPGTGKSMAIKALMNELLPEIYFIVVDAASVLCKNYGESEAKLRSIFSLAVEQQPSVVVIDELDILCSNKKTVSDQEKRITATLASLLDDLSNGEGVVFIGITNKPDSVDSGLRRPGRFDREIEFPVPLTKDRIDILRTILNKCNHSVLMERLEALAETAFSFTGGDIMKACREAAFFALKREGGSDSINEEDLQKGLRKTRPSAMREVTLEVPRVDWSEIGGMQEVKQKLDQMVVWPLEHPDAFQRLGVMPPKGILMYGPPGCSKTMIGKALATASRLNFIAIKGPELFNKWVGESEREVRELFRKAKEAAPAILFFDEVDAMAPARSSSSGASPVGDRVLAQLLTEMDGIELLDGVVIVAATNRPDIIDPALMRPGRLDAVIYVPLPDIETRREIFEIRIKRMAVDFNSASNNSIQKLALLTEGYSGAEIVNICNEAGLLAMGENRSVSAVSLVHFEKAVAKSVPRTSSESVLQYEKYAKNCNK